MRLQSIRKVRIEAANPNRTPVCARPFVYCGGGGGKREIQVKGVRVGVFSLHISLPFLLQSSLFLLSYNSFTPPVINPRQIPLPPPPPKNLHCGGWGKQGEKGRGLEGKVAKYN